MLKADIAPSCSLSEVKRIFIHLGGRRAHIDFAGIHGVNRTLRAYAERPLLVLSKHSNHVGAGW